MGRPACERHEAAWIAMGERRIIRAFSVSRFARRPPCVESNAGTVVNSADPACRPNSAATIAATDRGGFTFCRMDR